MDTDIDYIESYAQYMDKSGYPMAKNYILEYAKLLRAAQQELPDKGVPDKGVPVVSKPNYDAKALEYVFGKGLDWKRIVDDNLTPPWPLEHHARAMWRPFAQAEARSQRYDLVVKILRNLPIISAKTGVPLFDAGTHDACEKIDELLKDE